MDKSKATRVLRDNPKINIQLIDYNSPLSLNYPCSFKIPDSQAKEGYTTFSSANQAFAYSKAVFFNREDLLEDIINLENMSKVGASLKPLGGDSWDKGKFRVMVISNLYKFKDEPEFQEALFKTNDDLLAFFGKSIYWNYGDLKDYKNVNTWTGLNNLHEVMQEIKDILRPQRNENIIY
ncbi:hypothetical protein [Levilactobacillus phage ENFP1]|nr:hypothetical protein [Levilactobacillus phage ENFP1]